MLNKEKFLYEIGYVAIKTQLMIISALDKLCSAAAEAEAELELYRYLVSIYPLSTLGIF